MSNAPIALFVYNRPLHTSRTIEALKHNTLASESDLVIFSDAPASRAAIPSVQEVRRSIKRIDGFKSITLVEQDVNQGLAASIIGGVTRLCDEYGKVIVLEDDIVTSPYFLEFMNTALDQYVDVEKVWHISGWNYPIDTRNLDGAFLFRAMNCWGWATWADRWQYFRKDPERLVREWNEDRIHRFNLEGANNFWDQVIRNHQGTMNTWAIFWYATIFENGGLCLNPARSYVENIGLDGSGVNCGETDKYSSPLSFEAIDHLPDQLTENREAVARIRNFYARSRPGLAARIRNDLRSYRKQIISGFKRKVSGQ